MRAKTLIVVVVLVALEVLLVYGSVRACGYLYPDARHRPAMCGDGRIETSAF